MKTKQKQKSTHLLFQLAVAILPLSLPFPVTVPVPLAMAISLPAALSVIIFVPVSAAGLMSPALFPRAAMITFPGTFSPGGETKPRLISKLQSLSGMIPISFYFKMGNSSTIPFNQLTLKQSHSSLTQCHVDSPAENWWGPYSGHLLTLWTV